MKGAVVPIPVHIWLPQTYPHDPPLFFVAPAAGSVVRPGNHVSVDRRCYHPYLAYWSSDVRRSTLLGAVREFQIAFAREPPIQQAVQTTAPQQRAPSNPPYPIERDAAPTNTGARPGEHTRQGHVAPTSYAERPPPPVPGKPGAERIDRVRVSGDYAATTPRSPVSEQISPRDYARRPPPSLPPRRTLAAEVAAIEVSLARNATLVEAARPVQEQRDLLADDADARTPGAVFDGRQGGSPAPERPNNPMREEVLHTIRSAIQERAEAGHRDFLAKLKDVDADRREMEAARDAVQRETAYLERTLQSAESSIATLGERIDRAQATRATADAAKEPDIDAALMATTVVHDQLFDLVCDELAIDDTIFTLGRAFDDGKLDLDVFLKHLRALAREQFLKRAHIAKITARLGGEPVAA